MLASETALHVCVCVCLCVCVCVRACVRVRLRTVVPVGCLADRSTVPICQSVKYFGYQRGACGRADSSRGAKVWYTYSTTFIFSL